MSTLNTTTVATRPTNLNNTTDVGKSYFETDSNKILVWDGSLFNEWNADYSSFNSLSALFDGTDDFINCGSDSGLNLTSAFTLSAWVKQSTVKAYNTFLFRRTGANGYQVHINNGTLEYYGGSQTRSFTTGLNSTTDWYHIVVTHTGSSVSGYVNGTQAGSSYTESITGVASAIFFMGKHHLASGYNFAGNIDEVAIWSSALSSSEVSEIYNTGSPIDLSSNTGNYSSSSNLVGYWRIGDASGDTASGGGTPADSSTIGTVKNIANPGTHDGTGSGGVVYSDDIPL